MNSKLLKMTIRSFKKRPLLSTLNLLGLSIGLGCFLVISLYVFQEKNYEKGFSDYDSIYRIEEHFLSMGRLAWTSTNLPYKLDEIPQIASHTRLRQSSGNIKVEIERVTTKAGRCLTADEHFFEVFDFELLYGSKEEALAAPKQLVLMEATARKLFGRADVVGEVIDLADEGLYTVTAVVRKSVLKSHINFDMLKSESERQPYQPNKWYGIGGYSYAKLKPQVSQAQLQAGLDQLTEEYVFPAVYPGDELTFEQWVESQNKVAFYAKPIRDIYLNSNLQFELGTNGDRQTRVTLSIIGLFILVVASINFMNLSTARSSGRTKEIGVRKVLGAGRGTLVRRFLTESVLATFLAAMIGAGLSELFIRLLNQNLGEVITVSLVNYPILLIYLALLVIVLGVLSGLYPAFYLSSAKMIPLLKGMKLARVLNLDAAKVLRNSLVVLQFTISTTLIIASLFVYQQLQHLKTMDLGFDKDQVLILPNLDDLKEAKYTMRNEFLRIPGVEQGSFTFRLPADGSTAITSTMLDSETSLSLSHFMTDPYLHETLGFNLIDGEWFNPELPQQDSLVIINEAAVKAIGLDDPVGQVFGNYWRIIGVVEDFYYGGLREAIGPAMFMYTPERHDQLALRIDTEEAPLADLESVWNRFSDEPFEYRYLDQNFERQLKTEKQNADAVLIFTLLAILISCLGLFGLAAFTADQRLHEFGIRKVLGASIKNIMNLFSLDFLKLISIAFLIAVPLAVYGMNLWLQGFNNRIGLNVWSFVVAGAASVLIAFLTIVFQSLKAGNLNPIDTLRNE